jgi:hypothetical protein
MFATVEEAAKAATMLQRFGRVGSITQAGPYGFEVCIAGVGEPFEDWEQVADFLLARQKEPPQEDRPARVDRAEALAYVETARAIVTSCTGDRDQAIIALTYAVEKALGLSR